MASGRVGGTKSLKSGSVASTVYQIVRNPDGTYSQVVRSKGEVQATFTSPRLQAQRMCTGMVESLMKQLRKIASISFQSAANKSKSLNAFSSFNIRLVAEDCKTNWYQKQQFNYPFHSAQKIYVDDLGGPYIISAGTLQFDLFDFCGIIDNWFLDYMPPVNPAWDFYALSWDIPDSVVTVGQFFRRKAITRLDTICLVGYWYGQTNKVSESGALTEHFEHLYCILKPNPAVPDDTVISSMVLRNLFTIESNHEVRVAIQEQISGLAIGWVMDNSDLVNVIPYLAAFSISYLDGKKKISSSRYKFLFDDTSTWLPMQSPSYVFGSWIGDPANRNYPSPF